MNDPHFILIRLGTLIHWKTLKFSHKSARALAFPVFIFIDLYVMVGQSLVAGLLSSKGKTWASSFGACCCAGEEGCCAVDEETQIGVGDERILTESDPQ